MNTTEVENFPGFPGGIQGPELMAGLAEQATRFGAVVEYDDAATVDLAGHLKEVTTLAGKTYRAPAVIVATGSAYEELGPPEEKSLSGHGVSWCATCDGFFFRDQDTVVGGGDSGMEEALFLTRFARSVTVVDARTTHTNLTEVFACGDAVDHRYRQAITAAGTGCAAALDAERYLAALTDADSIATALVEEPTHG